MQTIYLLLWIYFDFNYIYKFIIMLICYVTIKLLQQTCLLISSIVVYTELQRTHKMTSLGPIAQSVSLIPRGLYTRCCWLGWHFLHTHQTREKVSQTPLHTVYRKHVVQPGNRNKTLGTGVSLNMPQLNVTGSRINHRGIFVRPLLITDISRINPASFRKLCSMYVSEK